MRFSLVGMLLALASSAAMAAPSAGFVVQTPPPVSAFGETIDLQSLAEASLTRAGCHIVAAGAVSDFALSLDAALSEGQPSRCEYAVEVTAADGKVVISEPSVIEDKICSTVWLKQEVSRAMVRACDAAKSHGGLLGVTDVPKQGDPEARAAWRLPVGIAMVVAGVATLAVLGAQHGKCDQVAPDGACVTRHEGFGFGAGALGGLGLLSAGAGLFVLLGGQF